MGHLPDGSHFDQWIGCPQNINLQCRGRGTSSFWERMRLHLDGILGCDVCEAGPSYKKQKQWPGKMAHWIKCLLCKHEALTSHPLRAYTDMCWRVEMGRSHDLLASESNSNKQLQVRWEVLCRKRKQKKNLMSASLLQMCTCMHTHAHTCTYMHTHTLSHRHIQSKIHPSQERQNSIAFLKFMNTMKL